MSDRIAAILIIALAFDALANVARLVAVEIQYRRQARLNELQTINIYREIDTLILGLGNVLRETITEMKSKEES